MIPATSRLLYSFIKHSVMSHNTFFKDVASPMFKPQGMKTEWAVHHTILALNTKKNNLGT